MDNFQTRLRIAFRMGKCTVAQAARESQMSIHTLNKWTCQPHTLRRSNAERLGKCAIRHLNEQIQFKYNEIKELRAAGAALKEAFKEVYGEDGKVV